MVPHPLDLHTVAPRWWAFRLRALCHLALAVVALAAAPGKTGLNLVRAFGILATADGLLLVVCATRKSYHSWFPAGFKARGAFFLDAALGLVLGALALAWPGMSEGVLRGTVCAYATGSGLLMLLLEEATFNNGGRGPQHEGWHTFGGLVSVAFGVAFAIWGKDAIAGRMFVAFVLVEGVSLWILSVGLREFRDRCCPLRG